MKEPVQNNTGLVVLYGAPQPDRWETLRGGQWRVLSFLSEEEDQEFLDASRSQEVQVLEVVRAAQQVDSSALRAREKYCAFIADWPERYRHRQRTFKELFTYRGELAYWWLTYASMKDNEISPTFQYLCHLEIIRGVLRMGSGRCILIGQDPMMALLVGRACAALKVPFHAPASGLMGANQAVLGGLGARLWFVGRLLAFLVLFRTLFRRRQVDTRAVIAFYTLFPTLLRLADGIPVDRNYQGFPGEVCRQGDGEAVYLATFSPESWRDWRLMWRQRKELQSHNSPGVVILESYLRFSDLALVVSVLLFFFRYLWLDRMDRRFRESFQYDGINIFELVRPEFARSFLGNQLPYYLVLARLVERAVRDLHVTHLVCYLEFYSPGRAVYYGAKVGRPDVTTVAYQHANISRMKLWYSYSPREVVPLGHGGPPFIATMPVPDRYLFQGENGLRVILESGYPEERCRVTGSPRYDALGDILCAGSQRQPPPNTAGDGRTKTVLVIPSLSDEDAQDLVETCVKACASSTVESRVLVKPHPSSSIGDTIPAVKAQWEFPDVQVVRGDLYQHIRDADVVVTSYSTAGDEAIALGCPVICYTGLRPSMSTFLDIPAAPVVHDAGELRSALESIFNDPQYLETYRAQWPALIEGSFYRLDGRGCERMVEALLTRS